MSRFTCVRVPFLLSCVALCPAQDRIAAPTLQVGFDATTGALSVSASGQPLSQILARLQDQHGVRVTCIGLADRPVQVAFAGLPLIEALQALMGSGATFQLDLGDHDIVLPPPANQPAMPFEPVDPGRPDHASGPIVRPDLPEPPDAAAVASARPGYPMMPDASRIAAEPILGDGLPLEPEADTGPHACLVLSIRKDGAVIEGLFEAGGTPVAASVLVGEWIWELRIDGTTVQVGSMADPLAVRPICGGRPLDPRRRPELERVDAARVVLNLDPRLLDASSRARATLRFARLGDGAGLPAEFSVATFHVFGAKADDLFTVSAQAMTAVTVRHR